MTSFSTVTNVTTMLRRCTTTAVETAVLSKKRSDFVTVRIKYFILLKGSTLLAVGKRSASDNLATGVGADCAKAKVSHI